MVRHQPEGLEQLQAQTQFTRKELQSLYRGFKNVSPPVIFVQNQTVFSQFRDLIASGAAGKRSDDQEAACPDPCEGAGARTDDTRFVAGGGACQGDNVPLKVAKCGCRGGEKALWGRWNTEHMLSELW